MLVSQVDTLKKNADRVNGKLKSMASLQFGDKWNTTSQSPQKNTILTAILRTVWYRSESLEMTVADFNATLEEAFMIVYECLDKYPSYQPDEQNVLTRIIVQLTGSVANVKMAVIRQKGTYQNDPQKESARSQLDDTITYIDDQLKQIKEAVDKAGLKGKIDADYRARNHKSRNPIIIGTANTQNESSESIDSQSPPTSEYGLSGMSSGNYQVVRALGSDLPAAVPIPQSVPTPVKKEDSSDEDTSPDIF